ncbi:hypothetical protein OSB04_005372 [Centaurea solstitialis]|uniref:Reverse transcriptase domain-containing protein n=1 Tax=Centaurea solstitialis TaxID=347529 RepID=A0AA38WGE3_9ASTR|nr:hypothetical protein OSB04_005372 [Centaurea solstitialis]
MGFGEKWRSWMKGCICTAKVSVIINGSPTKEFTMGKGVRQGDPLAPFLFILAVEGLTVALKEAQQASLVRGVRINNLEEEISLFQFADDAIFLGEWSLQNAKSLLRVLKCFEVCSGLKINLGKSRLSGVSVSKEEVILMANKLDCKADSIPFRYLGLPVGGNMNLAKYWQPLVEKFKSKLTDWKAQTLSIGAPKSVLKQLEGMRRRFLWGGTTNTNKICWMAWDKVMRDKQCGGLGIGSLRALNLALLLKWHWREKTEPNAMWNKVVKCCYGRTRSGGASNYNHGTWNSIFGVEKDLVDLGINVGNLLKPKEDGSGWVWELDPSNEYTVKSMRKLIDGVMLPTADTKTEWIRWVPNNCNIFLWRTLYNRLPTRDNLQKRGVEISSVDCPICHTELECLNHLMLSCSTAKTISAHLANWVDWWPTNSIAVAEFWDRIRDAGKKVSHEDICKVIGVAFLNTMWNMRNSKVFNGEISKDLDIVRCIQTVAFNWIRCRSRGDNNLSIPLFLLSTIIFLLLVVKVLTKPSSLKNLPPGPPRLPIIGNLHQVGDRPHVSTAKFAKEYGPLISLRLGKQVLVVASSPEAAMEILKTQDRFLSSRVVPTAFQQTSLIPHSVIWSECNQTWKNLRTLCRTEMFSSKALQSQSKLRDERLGRLKDFLHTKQGQVINVEDVVFTTLFNTLSSIIFARDFLDLSDEHGTRDGLKESLRKIIEYGGITKDFGSFFPMFERFDLQGIRKGTMRQYKKTFAHWEDIIEERRARIGSSTWSSEQAQSFVDRMLENGFSNDQINQLVTELFVAGTNTTTTSVVWAMTELVRHKEVMSKIVEEIGREIKSDTITDSELSQLPYLQACIKEAMRLHPPVPLLLPHMAAETCEVMNYTIPKNSKIFVNLWAMGRDPKVWDDPLSFKPERFIGSKVDFKGQDFELLPFGSGRRMCPGMPSGVKSVQLILASLIREFDLVLPDDVDPLKLDMNDKFGIALKMETPLKLLFKQKEESRSV